MITGSANLSLSAFGGYQRENIIVFDDDNAYGWYKNRFEDFKNICSDYVSEIKKIKHPYDHGVQARIGIEF